MYVKEPKELVTIKFFHCQHVSEQNRSTAGGESLYVSWRTEVEEKFEEDVPMVHLSAALL